MQTLERIFSEYRHWQDGHPPETRRRSAAEQLRELGLPGVRDEQWRYANLRALDQVPDFAPAAPAAPSALVPALPEPVPGFARLIFNNGLAPDDLPRRLPPGVSVHAPSGQWYTLLGADERLALLQQLFGAEASVLRVNGAAQLEILYVAQGSGASYPALHLELAPGARLELIERHLGAHEAGGLICPHVRIALGATAELQHYRIQNLGTRSVFYDTLSVQLAESARYRVCQVALGAATARTSALLRLQGRAAALEWHGLSAARDQQVSDCRVRCDHVALDTASTALFRGLASARARVGFDGDVQVIANAHGAKVRQSLRGLLEGSGSEVNLRPRLTIHTDQIEATHGATTGQLDEQLLFYLLSRGLDPATARALLKSAFLGDALAAIGIAPLRQQIEQSLVAHLGDLILGGIPT
jgi:Fe-S cluster assembly protein SufD